METDQVEVFRQSLLQQKQELLLLDSASSDAAGTVVLDQSKVGRLSRMDALQAQQMAQETARRRRVQLQKIDAALARMDAGDYGYCLKCGEDILIARLEFDPASTRCMAWHGRLALQSGTSTSRKGSASRDHWIRPPVMLATSS